MLQLAEDVDVELEFIPVAVEALVFITYVGNLVSKITLTQILDSYTQRKITNWEQLGGYDMPIVSHTCNPHLGS